MNQNSPTIKQPSGSEMADFPSISAVVPSYNQGDYVGKALESIFMQNYPHLEVIVVDGKSTDNTLEVLKNYGDRIRWVSEKDKNQADALNKGFRMAKGDIVAWLNTDDLYDAGAFYTIGKYFAEHPECMWFYGRCIIIDEYDREIRKWITAYKNFFLRHYHYDLLLFQNFLSQMGIFFRRKVLDEIGYLDDNLRNAMDYDFWLRLGKKYEPVYIDQNFGKFRVHTGSKTVKEAENLFYHDYESAKKHAGGKRFPVLLHQISNALIIFTYKILRFFESAKSRKYEASKKEGA